MFQELEKGNAFSAPKQNSFKGIDLFVESQSKLVSDFPSHLFSLKSDQKLFFDICFNQMANTECTPAGLRASKCFIYGGEGGESHFN